MQTHYRSCNLCEAICGLAIEHDGEKVHKIRGDKDDPFSQGHICPKGVALQDLHEDPDRLRHPVRRREDGSFEEVGWEEAFALAGKELGRIQREHGMDAVSFYYGNPTGHSYDAMMGMLLFGQFLGTRNIYSANSVDALPRVLTSLKLYGNQATLPIPDLDRTDFLLVLGANPVVSNGSVMTAPGVTKRLKALRQRGGTLVVVDPRRTETAAIADAHHFIRPGTDALLLLALLRTLSVEGRIQPGRLAAHIEGVGLVEKLVAPFVPELCAPIVGIPADAIVSLARDFADAPSAVCYGRMGTCAQEFGALTTWLIDLLNILTGNLDRPGGAMFPTPAADLAWVARLLKQTGSFDTWRSRIRDLPEFNGETPTSVFAEEIQTPGPGQIRALLTHAGNPALSLANGRALEEAFAKLDFMVSIDFYINETTRHANLILPPTSPLEHDNYALLFNAVAIRNVARYSPPLFAKPNSLLDAHEIFSRLAQEIGRYGRLKHRIIGRAQRLFARFLTPAKALDFLLRIGPHKLSLDRLRVAPHGLDLGPLVPRLPEVLDTPKRKISLVPTLFARDLARLKQRHPLSRAAKAAKDTTDTLLLIGRRHLRSNNSWMHNSQRLVKGPDRCTLLMHPDDAAARRLKDGDRVTVASRVGRGDVALEVSDEVMRGVVSLPHGWGHHRPDTHLSVARERPGLSLNDLTDHTLIDKASGTSNLNAVPVTVTKARRRAPVASV